MSESRDNEIDFSWGRKRGRGGQNKEVQFYESFTYDGVEYFLYDSVFLFKEGEDKPYIGKLIKIWELSNNKARKVKVLWFFYPSEISNYLIGENVLENELFLASGFGKGLANVNPLETIAGKCNVVCISKDERNRQPSEEEVKMAHYVFYRTFDVQNHTISDKLDESIAMIEVKFLMNKNDFQSMDLHMVDSANVAVGLEKSLSAVRDIVVEDGAVVHDASIGSPVVNLNKGAKSIMDKSKGHHLKSFAAGPDNPGPVSGMKRKLINDDQNEAVEVVEYDGSVGFLSVKKDKAFEGKDNAAGHDNLGPVSLLSDDVALDSRKTISLRSPDFKQKGTNEKCVAISSENRVTQKSKIDDTVHTLEQNARSGLKPVDSGRICFEDSVPPVTAADDRESDLGKGDHKAINAGLIIKSKDKQSKKLKVGGSAPLSSNNDGTSTLKVATALTKNASKSVVAATESQDRGRLTKESNRISDDFSRNRKSEENSREKLHGASLKQAEDKQGPAAIYVAAKKPSQSTHGNAETDEKSKVNKQMIGTSNGTSKKLKSNIKVEDKSNDKIIKVEDSNCKLRKMRLKDESKEAEIGAHGHVKEVTQRPHDRSKWFTARPWEERLKEACDQGRLVLLHNLDLTYASSDVENIVWHGFSESCTAKVVQHTATSCQHSGQAFIICKTREAADKIVMMLDQKCLMLPNGRPLLGCREEVRFPGKHSPFPGHLILDKLRHQMQRESREAVSTSHSSQPNTIEYEMALEWRLLQDRSELCWKMMYKKQAEEIKKLKASMKPRLASAR